MIPVFLGARLQLFDQFSAHFHMYDVRYLMPNPDFIYNNIDIFIYTNNYTYI